MAATAFTRSRSAWSRLLSLRSLPLLSPHSHLFPSHLNQPSSLPRLHNHRHFSARGDPDDKLFADGVVQGLLAELEREKRREKEEKGRAGATTEEEGEGDEEEDYMGVGPLIEKLERQSAWETDSMEEWEPTDSDSDEDDEGYSAEEIERQVDEFERKSNHHGELLRSFAEAETLDEAHNLMMKIEKFEEKHLKFPLEYRVIGDLMNRLEESTGKERFVLLQKLNRASRMMEIKEAYDPNNPANFGSIQHQQVDVPEEIIENAGFQQQKQIIQGEQEEDDDEFDKEKDEELMKKINAIEKKIEEKLTLLDHTFGKKGRVLEEEIKELVEERNLLTERKRRPLYRKGFDVKVIDVNRTCKVTKGGQLAKFSALLATGNYNGVVGFARAKGPTAKIAIQRAYEKCFQNLHYMERYEEHTIAHAIQAQYEKTKIYLWPGPLRSGMSAGRTVETVLYLAGFSNVKSKIIGSRNPLNVIKALFKALNAIETPKDVQEKFGRTVLESYLMH
ncbi:30S ribosomal protein S5 [Rhynchospora pubera]|uniref:30S ribosomal protein S5 n=1 Tax=Rhynchospora pubera TaxID=906938 RepID=A0AAV8D5C1_9POAL|nr:30S ribosomal protein S5 [Rhynchospora pubera]